MTTRSTRSRPVATATRASSGCEARRKPIPSTPSNHGALLVALVAQAGCIYGGKVDAARDRCKELEGSLTPPCVTEHTADGDVTRYWDGNPAYCFKEENHGCQENPVENNLVFAPDTFLDQSSSFTDLDQPRQALEECRRHVE